MNPFDWSGPDFLFFYIVMTVIALIVASLLRKMLDGGENAALQSPQTIVSDPYLIAHLRGGADETLRVAAMSLIDRGLLTVESDGTLKTAPNVRPEHARRHIERAILGAFTGGGNASALSSLKSSADEFEDRLCSLGLLPGGALRVKRFTLFLVMLAIVGGVAAIKMWIGITRDRPITFLLMLSLFSVALLWSVVNRRRTSHGESLLRSVKRLFAGLKDRASSIHRGGGTADLALLAAVFGMTAVPAEVFPYRSQLMPPANTSTSSCGSSSSCSSSSCGGGGCGGGGCGGCGG